MMLSYENFLAEKQAEENYDRLNEWLKNQDVEDFDIPKDFYLFISTLNR